MNVIPVLVILMLHATTLKAPSPALATVDTQEMGCLVLVRVAFLNSLQNKYYRILDIDECDSSPCHPNASCSNTEGSFICTCNSGYMGDGMFCASKYVKYGKKC